MSVLDPKPAIQPELERNDPNAGLYRGDEPIFRPSARPFLLPYVKAWPPRRQPVARTRRNARATCFLAMAHDTFLGFKLAL
jgi:hypothetical protein